MKIYGRIGSSTPQAIIRLQVEVGTNIFGKRYHWVESIKIMEEEENGEACALPDKILDRIGELSFSCECNGAVYSFNCLLLCFLR